MDEKQKDKEIFKVIAAGAYEWPDEAAAAPLPREFVAALLRKDVPGPRCSTATTTTRTSGRSRRAESRCATRPTTTPRGTRSFPTGDVCVRVGGCGMWAAGLIVDGFVRRSYALW